MMTRFLVLVIFLSVSFNSQAAVSLPWETTVDCADWSSSSATQPGCDGLEWPNGTQSVDGNYTSITSSANNPLGTGKGIRFWVGDGHNVNSAVLWWHALSPQTELWIRWYQRHEAGFAWDPLQWDKTLYIRTGATSIDVIPGFANNSYVLLAQGSPDYYQVDSNFTWNDIMGGSTSDGNFHCYEIHLKMDTGGYNGIGQLWIDGVLRASNTSVNWSNGDATAMLGWEWFGFEENQNAPANGAAAYIDYDDMVIYNTTPPSVDAYGNSFIGPISTIAMSGLVPAMGAQLSNTMTQTTIGVDTNTAATCRWGYSPGLSWSGMNEYDTTGGTKHSENFPVVAGGVYQICSRCFDTVAQQYSADSCSSWSVSANEKKWWWRQ